jgi:YVTN family beta-propeller protein
VIEFRVLGPFEAVGDDSPIVLGPPRQRALLALLLIYRGHTLSTDRLVDALWDGRPPPSAPKIVQGYVSSLRRVLGEDRLLTRGRGYQLVAAESPTDADRFERLVADGQAALRGGDAARAVADLRSALELWRGPALSDLADEPFANDEIARLEDARLTALELRLESGLALGEHRRLVDELRSLVRANPLREAFTAQLMLALYRCGRQAEALESYGDTRRRLIEDLGLEPGPALRELHEAVLRQDPALLSPAAPGPPRSLRASRGVVPMIIVALAVVIAAAVAVVVNRSGSSRATPIVVRPNSVVGIDTADDRVVASVGVGARPGAIAIADGSLWVADQDDDTISQVDPRTQEALRAIPVGTLPHSLAAAGGDVWVAGSSAGAPYASVRRIDPRFDTIDRRLRLASVLTGETASVASAGKSVWVAASAGELTRIDESTGRVARRLDPNGGPTGIAVTRGGDVWMIDNEADDLIELDPAGRSERIPVGDDPSSVAVGDGSVWVTDTGDDTLLQIDPTTRAVRATIEVGRAPLGIAVGAGAVWVADSGDGTVRRIDPSSAHVTAVVSVGGSPQDLAVDGDRVWATVDARGVGTPATLPTGGTIRIDYGADPAPLDPALVQDPLGVQLLDASCAKLVAHPDRNGPAASALEPEVAQSLPARSHGGRTYTFTIRPGYRFSGPSNAPVTAGTFRYELERILAPRMKSPWATDFMDMVGARAYHAGRTHRLAGVQARGNRLVIRLTAPAPDLTARMAVPAMCAVPADTPISPQGANVIPSAGPYRISSYIPGQDVVLTRNPDYRGPRPHRASRITVALDIPPERAVAAVQAGTADYAPDPDSDPLQAARLAARYGPASATARAGAQRYFVEPRPALDFFGLNSHRPLFAAVRLRRAVSDAINRRALARLGDRFFPLPERPTALYIPPGVPGYRSSSTPRPNLARARMLARPDRGRTVVLGTCDASPCGDQADIIRRALRRIGLRVRVEALPIGTLFAEEQSPHDPFDMSWVGWIPDYFDPDAMLGTLVGTSAVVPSLRSPRWHARLQAASRLGGPPRDLAYARLDAQLAREAVPLVAFGNVSDHDFFSARMGCEEFGPYGVDLAALCVRRR